MAGLATSFWQGLDDLKANWAVDREFEPQWDEARRADGYHQWLRAVERAKGWVES